MQCVVLVIKGTKYLNSISANLKLIPMNTCSITKTRNFETCHKVWDCSLFDITDLTEI